MELGVWHGTSQRMRSAWSLYSSHSISKGMFWMFWRTVCASFAICTMITKHAKKYKAKWNAEWRKKHPEEYRKYNREYQRKRREKLKRSRCFPIATHNT